MTGARAIAALALAGSCTLPAACASTHHAGASSLSPSTSSTTGRPVAKPSFVRHASAACQYSNGQLRDAAGRALGRQRPTPAAWRAFMISTALPIISHRLDTIAAPPRPRTDNTTIAATGKNAVTRAKNNPHLLSPASPAPFATFDRLATAYGIPATKNHVVPDWESALNAHHHPMTPHGPTQRSVPAVYACSRENRTRHTGKR